MQLLTSIHCSNEHDQAVAMLIEIDAEQARLIVQRIDQCTAFLSTIGSQYFGRVELECPVNLTVLHTLPEGWLEQLDEEVLTVPDDFEPHEDHRERTECHTLRVYADGDCYFQAQHKHSSDEYEARSFYRANFLALGDGRNPFAMLKLPTTQHA